MLQWLVNQIEWLKSFVSHGSKPGEQQKGKTQSVAIVAVTLTFCFTYIRVSLLTQKFEDVPMTWAMLIAFIIGAKIYDSAQVKKQAQ